MVAAAVRSGEYIEEAIFYQQQLLAACEGSSRTLLELGSGGGNNASHLKARLEWVALIKVLAIDSRQAENAAR